jgi:hypothetical protein
MKGFGCPRRRSWQQQILLFPQGRQFLMWIQA